MGKYGSFCLVAWNTLSYNLANLMDYLIWSFKNRAWWGPNYRGLTRDVDLAGRYNAIAAGEAAVNHPSTIIVHEHLAELYGPPTVQSLWGDRVKY